MIAKIFCFRGQHRIRFIAGQVRCTKCGKVFDGVISKADAVRQHPMTRTDDG